MFGPDNAAVRGKYDEKLMEFCLRNKLRVPTERQRVSSHGVRTQATRLDSVWLARLEEMRTSIISLMYSCVLLPEESPLTKAAGSYSFAMEAGDRWLQTPGQQRAT